MPETLARLDALRPPAGIARRRLVPVALAALPALVFPRLRAGARAGVALTAAPLMIVIGAVDGVRHVAVDRLAGNDLTAIACGAAGTVLIVLAAIRRPYRRHDRTRGGGVPWLPESTSIVGCGGRRC